MKYLLLTLALGLGSAAPLAAQEAFSTDATASQDSADREARALFDAGSVAFGEGRYESAIRHFENAYALSPRPGMLFNLATTYDRLHRETEALDHFRRYLEAIPNASNRDEAEARIRALEASAASAPATSPPVDAVARADTDLAPLALLISGGVLAFGGGITLALGLVDASNVESARDVSYASIRDAYERGPILQGVGAATFGVGVALAAVGGLMLSLSSTSETRVSLLPNGFSIEGTF